MKTGLFFGSFNPIHIGHLIIGNYFVEFTDLEKVWFVVSPQNPLKKKSTLLPDYHRLALVRLAIENDNRLNANDIEFNLPKPSYTINTLTYLKEKYPQHQFVLIMGTDNLKTLHKWKNYETLLEQYEIYTYPRPKKDGGALSTRPKVKTVDAPQIEISSSFIRNAIKNKKDIRYMLPEKVYQYMVEMHFYEPPFKKR